MSEEVNIDHEKFILLVKIDSASHIPFLIEKAEYEKFDNLMRKYLQTGQIPNEETIEIYSMKKNDNNVWEVLENSKHIAQANKYIDSFLKGEGW